MNRQKIQLKSSCKERFAPVVKAIEQLLLNETKERIIVALDGRCASGKSTLGFYLMELFDANFFHLDDFFLQKHQRTKERLAEVGGNVDYERFKEEVLDKIQKGEIVEYRRFDCKSMQMMERVSIAPKRLNIIEGSYAGNPYFGNIYDLKVFMDIGNKAQLQNILKRDGAERLGMFKERWIPKEEAYFEMFKIREKSDIVVEWRETK